MIKIIIKFSVIIIALLISGSSSASPVRVNQETWSEFSFAERIGILAKFPDIEVTPTEAVGSIQSVQVINRSVATSNSGAALGSVLGQAAYIDHTTNGIGSNYSAKTQVGVALLGAIAGSALDSPGYRLFVLNYGIRTMDGQTREVHVESADDLAKPNGQCVFLADLSAAPPMLCMGSKIKFLKHLSSLSDSTSADQPRQGNPISRSVQCRVPNVGLMTLESSSCNQLEGTIEK